jgi:hypothetical protein
MQVGAYAYIAPYGALRVTDESTMEFFSALDTLDTVKTWTTKISSGSASVSGGVLTCGSSTTASAWGGVQAQATVTHKGLSFVNFGAAVQIPVSTIANTSRMWGMFTIPTTPTMAVPVTDGYGFLLDAAGSLYGVVWAAGVQVGAVNLTAYKPADGVYTRYGMSYRSDLVMFFVQSSEYSVGSLSYLNPAVEALPPAFIAVANSSAPASSATILVQAVGVGDSGKNSMNISDPLFPSQKARVTNAGALVTHPYVDMDTGTPWDATSGLTPLTATTSTAMKAGVVGLRNYLTGLQLYNTHATVSTLVTILDGVTVLWTGYLPAITTTLQVDPCEIQFARPLRTSVNAALNIQCASAGNVYWNAQGFVA